MAYQDKNGTWWYPSKDIHRKCPVFSCLTCGKEFPGYPRDKDKKWCSDECVRASCSQCGKSYRPGSARQKWCSLECKGQSRITNCIHCEKSFIPSKNAGGNYCSLRCYNDHTTPVGTRMKQGHGYVLVKVPEGTPGAKKNGTARGLWMYEHRYVIQESLGRPLLPSETVHHRNGIRHDNRLENLELWTKAHGAGARRSDIVREMIKDDPRAVLQMVRDELEEMVVTDES